jgi:aminotransferase
MSENVIGFAASPGRRSPISQKAGKFTESVIREMTRLALQHDAVNLAQGFPDFPAPEEVKEAAVQAIRADINQYEITWGAREFRRAIGDRFRHDTGLEVDPEREMTVCCGATETMIASLLAIIDPGDEVVVFEPYYENYGPDAIICGAATRHVRLHPPDWTFDPQELAAAFTDRTRAVILNTPNNPTGKVFTRAELELIAEQCKRTNAYAITDEIYQYLVYDGFQHISLMTLPGMRERTIAIRKMHDFLTVGAAAPLQQAGATALRLPETYYQQLCEGYQARRDRMLAGLEQAGFRCFRPHGAYYIMADISAFGFPNDVEFARYLVQEIGVGVVPGSSFYRDPAGGAQQVRFAYCKKAATLDEALRRLEKLRA